MYNVFYKKIIAAFLLVLMIIAILYTKCTNSTTKEIGKPVSTESYSSSLEFFDNIQRAEEISEDIFSFICLIEGGAGEEGKTYFCGARWTTWYGVTMDKEGHLLKEGDHVSKKEAKELAIFHLKERVYPFLAQVTRKLSDEQIVGICLFIYNVGGEAFSGCNIDGQQIGEPSRFLLAINANESDEYCVNCLTRYRSAGGKRANGLLKRHWVEAAAYLGILTADNIGDLEPCKFYRTKNMGNYYWVDKKRDPVETKDGLFQLRFDDYIINNFFNMNEGDSVTVNSIK